MLTSPTGFLLVARSDHTTGSRNIKPEVVFKVQKMSRHASFYLIMPIFVRLWPVRVRVSFTTGAVELAILATAGLLVPFWCRLTWVVPDKTQEGRKTVLCVCVHVRVCVPLCMCVCAQEYVTIYICFTKSFRLQCFLQFDKNYITCTNSHIMCLQCFDAVGWVSGRASGL